MLSRCYSEKYHLKQPTYKNCCVCEEWLIFSNFRSWMEKQDWKGNHLDKDLLKQSSKVYSPDTCIFVTPKINELIKSSHIKRGDCMMGVDFHKKSGKFRATINNVKGNKVHIGLYESEIIAHEEYKKYKYNVISKIANEQLEPLKSALLCYKIPMY